MNNVQSAEHTDQINKKRNKKKVHYLFCAIFTIYLETKRDAIGLDNVHGMAIEKVCQCHRPSSSGGG